VYERQIIRDGYLAAALFARLKISIPRGAKTPERISMKLGRYN